MACIPRESKLITQVPLVNGALVLTGCGCNSDLPIHTGLEANAIDAVVAVDECNSGTLLVEIAGAYTLQGEMIAGQYEVYLDEGRVVFSPAVGVALKNARRFN